MATKFPGRAVVKFPKRKVAKFLKKPVTRFQGQSRVQVCKTDMRRYCEKFSNIFPFPVEEQKSHIEPKKKEK